MRPCCNDAAVAARKDYFGDRVTLIDCGSMRHQDLGGVHILSFPPRKIAPMGKLNIDTTVAKVFRACYLYTVSIEHVTRGVGTWMPNILTSALGRTLAPLKPDERYSSVGRRQDGLANRGREIKSTVLAGTVARCGVVFNRV